MVTLDKARGLSAPVIKLTTAPPKDFFGWLHRDFWRLGNDAYTPMTRLIFPISLLVLVSPWKQSSSSPRQTSPHSLLHEERSWHSARHYWAALWSLGHSLTWAALCSLKGSQKSRAALGGFSPAYRLHQHRAGIFPRRGPRPGDGASTSASRCLTNCQQKPQMHLPHVS